MSGESGEGARKRETSKEENGDSTGEAFVTSSLVASIKTPRGGNKVVPSTGQQAGSHLDNLRVALAKWDQMLKSESSDEQLEGTKKFRHWLSKGEKDPLFSVQDMLDQNVVPQLLQFLKKNGNTGLQVEALWALTNIAAGTTEHTHLLIKNNAVPTLVSLLDSTHQEVLEQAVWVLGNIAGDGTTARDTVLAAGILEPLLRCMHENKRTSLLRIATWTLSNLCDGQPRPVFKVGAVLRTIKEVLKSEDTEVLSHACWALSHLCDGPSPHIHAVVRADVCKRLVELLYCKTWRVVKPALRTVGNIVCAEDDQDFTQHIIECGAVPCLRDLIQHSNREIQKEACWTLSNIAAGTTDQIQCVLDSGSIPTLVELASTDGKTDPDVRIEACWVLLNATSCGSDLQIEHLVKAGCVSVLCTLLNDSSMVMMALEGLEKILQVGEDLASHSNQPGSNVHAKLLDTTKIEALQRHRSPAIAKRATKMWKQYFVICAICNTPYAKNSPETKFCSECKCNVCGSCDCSVYHLSYQDALWRDLTKGEAKSERNKQQSKKNKRKKKKAKEKKRRELQKAKNSNNNNNNNNSTSTSHSKKDEDKDDSDSDSDAEEETSTPKVAEEGIEQGENVEIEVDEDEEEEDVEEGEEDVPSSGLASSETPPPHPRAVDNNMPDVSMDSFAAEDLTRNGPDYVEFLSNNGSILDLWKMINENESSKTEDSPIPLESIH